MSIDAGGKALLFQKIEIYHIEIGWVDTAEPFTRGRLSIGMALLQFPRKQRGGLHWIASPYDSNVISLFKAKIRWPLRGILARCLRAPLNDFIR